MFLFSKAISSHLMFKIEWMNTLSWQTSLSVIILLVMLGCKYWLAIKKLRLLKTKEQLKSSILIAFIDLKRLLLWILFNLNNGWIAILIIYPLLQIASLFTVFLRKFKDKYEKILLIVNEAYLLIYSVKLMTNMNNSPLKINSEGINETVSFLFEFLFLPFLWLEVGFVTYHNIIDILL